jgi:hypothetical protein
VEQNLAVVKWNSSPRNQLSIFGCQGHAAKIFSIRVSEAHQMQAAQQSPPIPGTDLSADSDAGKIIGMLFQPHQLVHVNSAIAHIFAECFMRNAAAVHEQTTG